MRPSESVAVCIACPAYVQLTSAPLIGAPPTALLTVAVPVPTLFAMTAHVAAEPACGAAAPATNSTTASKPCTGCSFKDEARRRREIRCIMTNPFEPMVRGALSALAGVRMPLSAHARNVNAVM